MKNLFTSKKSLENVSIPSVQKIKNELYNEVDETQKTEVSEDSFVDSGIKVLKTTDYNKLRLRKDNRPLDFKHVQRLVISVALDNLGKGAASQAIQNANLMCGFHEGSGLSTDGLGT